MGEESTILCFIPSLVATLWHEEKQKGSALTESEVIAIRDNSQVTAMTKATARLIDEKRGYEDIDAGNCWPAWLEARNGLIAHEREKP